VIGTAVLIGGVLHLWETHQHRVIPAEDYELTADRVQITAAPKWATVDLKRLLLDRPAGQRPPTILDTDIVAKSAAKLQSVGWVQEVQQVKKSTKGLKVDVRYRQPVAMVALNPTTVMGWDRTKTAQVMPVDQAGIVMPPEVLQHLHLPKISVFQPQHYEHLTTWSAWPDLRVTDAAYIIAALGPAVSKLGVHRITTRRSTKEQSLSPVPFELWPQNGTQVIWGNAPGKEAVGEATAEVKRNALFQFVQQFGSLEDMPKRKVDLRSGRIVMTKDAHVAEKETIFAGLK
jgi:hypothetical protein